MSSVTAVSVITPKTTPGVFSLFTLPKGFLEKVVAFVGGRFISMGAVCRNLRTFVDHPSSWKLLAENIGHKGQGENTAWRSLVIPSSPIARNLAFPKSRSLQHANLVEVVRHKDTLFTVHAERPRSIYHLAKGPCAENSIYELPSSQMFSADCLAVSEEFVVCLATQKPFTHVHRGFGTQYFHVWQQGKPQKPVHSWKDSIGPINELTISEKRLLVGRYSDHHQHESHFGFCAYGFEIYDLVQGTKLFPSSTYVPDFASTGVWHVESLDSSTFLSLHEDFHEPNLLERTYRSVVRLWDTRHPKYPETVHSCEAGFNGTHLCTLGSNYYVASSDYHPSKASCVNLSQIDRRTNKIVKTVKVNGDQECSALTVIEGTICSGSTEGHLRLWDRDLNLLHMFPFSSPHPHISPCLSYIGGTADFLTVVTSQLKPHTFSSRAKFKAPEISASPATALWQFNTKKPLAAASASAATATAAAPQNVSDQKDNKSKEH